MENKKKVKKYKVSLYDMPLEKYCERRKGNKMGKGDWPRYVNSNPTDLGRFGCKDGKGLYHPMIDGKCKYCGLTKEQIKEIQDANT